MKKTTLRLAIILFFIMLILSIKVFAVEPTEEFFVNDYANILSDSTEQFVIDNSRILDDATTAQIVVVTVKNLDGRDIETYATELFRKWGIGDREKNNGLLILLALEERQCRIEVGYGLEGILPDGKTGRIQDEYMIPYFKDNDFDTGIKNGYQVFYNEIAQEYNFNSSLNSVITPAQKTTTKRTNSSYPIGNRKQRNETLESTIISLIIIRMLSCGIIWFINFKHKVTKAIVFTILEIVALVLFILMFQDENIKSAAYSFLINTVIAAIVVFTHASIGRGSGRGRGYYGGSSRGGSSGGGYSGRGGSSGGGGSTRSF